MSSIVPSTRFPAPGRSALSHLTTGSDSSTNMHSGNSQDDQTASTAPTEDSTQLLAHITRQMQRHAVQDTTTNLSVPPGDLHRVLSTELSKPPASTSTRQTNRTVTLDGTDYLLHCVNMALSIYHVYPHHQQTHSHLLDPGANGGVAG